VHAPAVTLALIVACAIAYVLDWDPDLADLWWPVAALASNFVNEQLLGLILNLAFLWLFAKSLEDALGPVRFVALVTLIALAAAGAQELADPETPVPSMGLAGTVAGLIGAYAVTFPAARILCWVLIPFFVTFTEIPALILAVVWLALQAIPEIGQPPVAGLAGGLAAGAVAVKVLAHGRLSAEPRAAV
jgi:membrane associated rhomboid family serine protease